MTEFVYVRPHSRSGTLTCAAVAEIADSLKQCALAAHPTELGGMHG